MENVKVGVGTLLDTFRKKQTIGGLGFKLDTKDLAPMETQVFILSPEVALAAHNFVMTKTFKPTPLSELRLPYPCIAIELPVTNDIRSLYKDSSTALPISRVGVAIRKTESGADGEVTCLPYWEYENGTLEHSVFSFTIGLPVDVPAPKVRIVCPRSDAYVDTVALPAMPIIRAAMKHGLPPDQLADSLWNNPNTKLAVEDGSAELFVALYAGVTLLNCKSGVTVTKVAAKKRPAGTTFGDRKRKDNSRSAYTLIYLNESETVTSEGVINRRSDVSAHYVRGHFKQRAKGVYWWNPFVRGSGKPRERVAYRVKEGTA